jgi:hypothetical protein
MELVQQPDYEYYIIDRSKSLMSSTASEDIFAAFNDFNDSSFNYLTNSQPSGVYSVNYPYVYNHEGDLDGTILCEFTTIDDVKEQLPELLI